jgi:hypothetical protein
MGNIHKPIPTSQTPKAISAPSRRLITYRLRNSLRKPVEELARKHRCEFGRHV